jgi:hypothetical protein
LVVKVLFPLLLPPQTVMILLLMAHTPFLKDQVQFAGVFGLDKPFRLCFGDYQCHGFHDGVPGGGLAFGLLLPDLGGILGAGILRAVNLQFFLFGIDDHLRRGALPVG